MFNQKNVLLLIVDVQGKLAHIVQEKELLFQTINQLIQAFQVLDMPILVTEQVPEKIGKTEPFILKYLKDPLIIEKTSFSCFGQKAFVEQIDHFKRKQIVVAGIETHVCVIQTVKDLIYHNYQVQVMYDAVSSRTMENKMLAVERMKKMGADISSAEMLICELLKSSNHEHFKEVMKLIK